MLGTGPVSGAMVLKVIGKAAQVVAVDIAPDVIRETEEVSFSKIAFWRLVRRTCRH
jgi:hypothetical protein